MPPSQPPTFFQLCCREPFRIFFPLGVLVGISGVSLWPLFFAGIHKFYPGVMHARMMVEGFLGAFVLGFLGTAVPLLTKAPHLSPRELRLLLLAYVAAVGFHIGECPRIGDLCFLILLGIFLWQMGARVARGKERLPKSFVLAGLGLANAMAGLVLLLFGMSGVLDPRCALLGSLLLNQSFALHLLLGVGGFLFPRRGIVFQLVIGTLLPASFAVEAFDPNRAAVVSIARFLAIAVSIWLYRPVSWGGTVGWSARLAWGCIGLGLLFPVLWPVQRVAGMHVLFIGGFSLITLTLATRVVLGHGGLFTPRLTFLAIAGVLLLIATTLRAVGDFFPLERAHLLSGASHAWMLAAVIWTFPLLGKFRAKPDRETYEPNG